MADRGLGNTQPGSSPGHFIRISEKKDLYLFLFDDKKTDIFLLMSDLLQAEPVSAELDGWEDDLTRIRNFDELPGNVKNWLRIIEELVGVPVKYISVRPYRPAVVEIH